VEKWGLAAHGGWKHSREAEQNTTAVALEKLKGHWVETLQKVSTNKG